MANGTGVLIIGALDTNADTDRFDLDLNRGEVYDFWMGQDFGGDQITDAALQLDVSPGGPQVAFDDNSASGLNATFLFSPGANGTFRLTAEEVTGTGDGGEFGLVFVNKSREADISEHLVGTTFTSTVGPDAATIDGIGTNAVLAEEDVLNSTIADGTTLWGPDLDTVAVFLTAGQTYSFTVEGADSGVTDGITDSELFLLNSNADVTSLNGGGSDTTIAGFDPASDVGTGWYFLSVTSGTDTNGGNYRLSFTDTSSGTPFDTDVPGGTGPVAFNSDGDFILANPFNLPLGDTIQGDLEAPGDADWYAIHLVEGFSYRFTGEGGSLGNVTLQVRDDNGNAEAGGAASGAEPQSVDFTPTASGLYYIDIHGQTGGDFGTFSLSSELLSVGTAGDTAHHITGIGGTSYAGSDLVDDITGGIEGDTIDGGLGDDTLAGGLGGDFIFGGSVPGGGDNSILGDDGNDTLNGFDGNDTLDGGADNDRLQGGEGGDTLSGGLGLDVMSGGEEGNSMDGGIDNDDIDGDGGNDTIGGGEGADTIGGGADNDTVTGGAGNDNIGGDNGNDSIDGGADNDQLNGGADNDTLIGGSGDDTLSGGAGVNQLFGNGGNDTFAKVSAGDNVTAGTGVDHIQSLIGWTLDADEENLTLIGGAVINGNGNTGNNAIVGNDQANQLSGLAGIDILLGGAGNDTLIGGAGKDLNTGGAGLDHIKYNALSDSGATFATRDGINTFAHGDKIDLSAIDANSNLAGNQAFTYSSAQALTGASGLLIVQQVATNAFLVLADVNGDHNADFSLNVYTSPGFGAFHNWDFIL